MIELRDDVLEISAPGVHREAKCSIHFQRTLRIPDDNRTYPLPAGLGRFPLFHVDDHAERVPRSWIRHGGVFLPMYQSEAMWIRFDGSYPFAVRVAAGKIDAVTGERWTDGLRGFDPLSPRRGRDGSTIVYDLEPTYGESDRQNYVVLPDQPWLDGFCVDRGRIRQFVAMPLGQGFTAEGQLTGEEVHGGLQIAAYPMKARVWERLRRPERMTREYLQDADAIAFAEDAAFEPAEMGLAPGGLMEQQIDDDPHGLSAWEQEPAARCFVHLADSRSFLEITGRRPPTEPLTPAQYRKAGIPWFEWWGDEHRALEGSEALAGLDSIATRRNRLGERVDEPEAEIDDVVTLGPGQVRQGRF